MKNCHAQRRIVFER